MVPGFGEVDVLLRSRFMLLVRCVLPHVAVMASENLLTDQKRFYSQSSTVYIKTFMWQILSRPSVGQSGHICLPEPASADSGPGVEGDSQWAFSSDPSGIQRSTASVCPSLHLGSRKIQLTLLKHNTSSANLLLSFEDDSLNMPGDQNCEKCLMYRKSGH